MASDTGATGRAFYLLWNTTVLDTNYRTFNTSDTLDLIDQTAGDDTRKTYLSGLTDGSASATIKYKAGDTAIWAALATGTSGTLHWGEEGSVSGKPHHYAAALVTGRSQAVNYNDLIVVDVSWQLNGAVTNGTF